MSQQRRNLVQNNREVNPHLESYQAQQSEIHHQNSSYLRYASQLNNSVVLNGSSDLTKVTALKNAILELKSSYFNPNTGLYIRTDKRDELDRRFLLIQHELQGLLKRNLEYVVKEECDQSSRNLDFMSLLKGKEAHITELEKRIQNLEERLRKANVREIELQNKIVALKAENFALRDNTYKGNKLEEAMRREARYVEVEKELQALKTNFSTAASIWLHQLSQITTRYPRDRFILDAEITRILQKSGVTTFGVNGFATVEVKSEKTVEIPVQDAKTKHLILLLAQSLKRLSGKYPKLLSEIDKELIQFFQQEIIDFIDIDSFDRVVQIVKFVPQAIRVENVYAYSSQKSRRVQFHLRVLIKALLEQFQKVKRKYKIVLDIDQGVIGMINQQILHVVCVDDILKVFRSNGKIVEVEKVIEKIVEKVVQIPQVVPVECYHEKIVEVPKFIEVEKIIHVPVEVIKVVEKIVEKMVEVPTIEERVVEVPIVKEKIVEIKVEVPRIVEVEKTVEKYLIDTKVEFVEKPVYIKGDTEYVQVKVTEQLPPVIVQTIVERIVEVPVYIQKIVEKIIEVPKIVQVQVVKEKMVVQRIVEVACETEVAVKEVIKEVILEREKIVKVQTIVPYIIEVTTFVDRLIPVRTIQTKIKEVEVIREVPRQVIKIERIKDVQIKVVYEHVEVEKIIDRLVEVPIIHERIVKVPEIINHVVVEKIHVPYVITVKEFCDKIVTETKIKEIENRVIVPYKDVQIVNCIVEKIVEIPRIIERFKEVKVKVEKIVEKLVEVPRVIEVEKVVERIVCIPRIIEKIVEVPKEVEKIVERVVEKIVVQRVECVVQRIVYVEKLVPVEVPKNIMVEVPKIIEKIVEKIVAVETVIESKDVLEIEKEKIVPYCIQVPTELIVQKINTNVVEKATVFQIQKPTFIPIKVVDYVNLVVEKAVPIQNIVEVIKPEIRIVEKPVPVQVKTIDIKQVQKRIELVVAVAEPKLYKETNIIVQKEPQEVPCIREKPVLVEVQLPAEIIQVDRFVETIVERIVEVPKVAQVKVIVEKMIENIKLVEFQKIVPKLITVHKIIKEVVDRIIPVVAYEEVAIHVPFIKEKVVEISTTHIQKQPVEIFIDKVIETCKLQIEENVTPHYQKQIVPVECFKEKEVLVCSTEEKIVQVPQILEKIVERIVVMPQVVEVLKYVHEIVESDSLFACSIDVIEQEKKYKELYGITHSQLQIIISELRRLRNTQPALSTQIELLVKYLADFDKLASLQRIVPVPHDRVVEKEVSKAVVVPTKDSDSIRNELAFSALIEKLVREIKRIKVENPSIKLKLDDQVGIIFYPEFYNNQQIDVPGQFDQALRYYTQKYYAKVEELGRSWGSDNEFLLANLLQERLAIATLLTQANIQIEKVRAISTSRGKSLEQAEKKGQKAEILIKEIKEFLENKNKEEAYKDNNSLAEAIKKIKKFLQEWETSEYCEPTRELGEFVGSGNDWNRLLSYARERQAQVGLLLKKILKLERRVFTEENDDANAEHRIAILSNDNDRLKRQIAQLTQDSNAVENRRRLVEQKLNAANAKIRDLEDRLKKDLEDSRIKLQEVQSQLYMSQKGLKELKESRSSETSSAQNNLTSSLYSFKSSNAPKLPQSPNSQVRTDTPQQTNSESKSNSRQTTSKKQEPTDGRNQPGPSYSNINYPYASLLPYPTSNLPTAINPPKNKTQQSSNPVIKPEPATSTTEQGNNSGNPPSSLSAAQDTKPKISSSAIRYSSKINLPSNKQTGNQ